MSLSRTTMEYCVAKGLSVQLWSLRLWLPMSLSVQLWSLRLCCSVQLWSLRLCGYRRVCPYNYGVRLCGDEFVRTTMGVYR